MIRNKTINIDNFQFKIFIANLYGNTLDTNTKANVEKIKKNNYNLGIILNPTDNIKLLEKELNLICYDSNTIDYYVLDIVHKKKGLDKKYRFIFYNIHLMVKGLLSENLIEEHNINIPKNTKLNESLKKYYQFIEWMIKSLNEAKDMNKIFMISDVMPYQYLKLYPKNIFLKNFLLMLEDNVMPNFIYISTDNDYYQNIAMYKGGVVTTKSPDINMIMVGSLRQLTKIPNIFNRRLYDNFYGDIGYQSDLTFEGNLSGFLEISSGKNLIKYVSLSNKDIINFVINEIIRLVSKSVETNLNNDELDTLHNYHCMVIYDSYLILYKYYNKSKRWNIELSRNNFLDKIINEANNLLNSLI